jgi:hypothetical protein
MLKAQQGQTVVWALRPWDREFAGLLVCGSSGPAVGGARRRQSRSASESEDWSYWRLKWEGNGVTWHQSCDFLRVGSNNLKKLCFYISTTSSRIHHGPHNVEHHSLPSLPQHTLPQRTASTMATSYNDAGKNSHWLTCSVHGPKHTVSLFFLMLNNFFY